MPLGDHAFAGCDKLEKVKAGVTKIGPYAFADCPELLTIDSPVTEVGDHAFENCGNLAGVIAADGCDVGEKAFAGSGVNSINGKMKNIGSGAFEGCVNLGPDINNLKCYGSMEPGAFKGCSMLSTVVIEGDTETQIGDHAFEDCTALTSITFPANAKAIGEGVVKGCTKLNKILVTGSGKYKGNPDDNNILFEVTGSKYKIIAICPGVTTLNLSSLTNITEVGGGAFAGGSFTSITLPGTVTSIGSGAFEGCTGLTGFELPEGVETIGGGLFAGCTSLTSVTVNSDNKKFEAYENSIIEKGTGTLVTGCNASGKIPATVTAIGNEAFKGCSGITGRFNLPSDLKSIGDYAFYGCTGITGMDIPDTVDTIGKYAFAECSGLKDKMTIPGGVDIINQNTFENCSSIPEVVLPDGLTEIDINAFNGCSSLTALIIPGSVKIIEDEAFQNCTSLTGDLDLRAVSDLKQVHNRAFKGCTGITSVVLPGFTDPDSMKMSIFEDCTGIESITFDTGLTFIPKGMFAGCTGIKELNLGQSIKTIGESAFEGASRFKEVLIYKEVSSIKKNAFSGTGVTKVNYTGTEDQWNTLLTNIEDGNDVLKNAGKEFNFVMKILPTKLTVSPASRTVHPGDTLNLKAVFTPDGVYEDYKAVRWSSSNPAFASVDEKTGVVTVKTLGEVIITAQTTNAAVTPALKAESKLTVKNPEYRVTFEPGYDGKEYSDSLFVEVGKTIDLDPAKFDREGFTLTGWRDEENKDYKADEKGIVINKDKTFTAQWKDKGSSEEEKTTTTVPRSFHGKNAEGQEVNITMDVEISKSVSYNGGKHVWSGSKATKSSVNDVVINISGSILDYIDVSKTKVTIKNNKDVSVGGSGKAPKVIIKLKQKDKKLKKTISTINKELKKNAYTFDINPLDLNTVKDTIEAKANKKKTKVTKVTCTVPFGSKTKKLKLTKKDYKADIDAAAGTAVLTGQKNCAGTVTVTLK